MHRSNYYQDEFTEGYVNVKDMAEYTVGHKDKVDRAMAQTEDDLIQYTGHLTPQKKTRFERL